MKNEDINLSYKGNFVDKSDIHNISEIILKDEMLASLFGYDDFFEDVFVMQPSKGLPEIKKGRYSDLVTIAVRSYISRAYKVTFSRNDLMDQIRIVALEQNRFNSAKQRIEKRDWDGKKRVANFFTTFLGVYPNEYSHLVAEAWFTGLVKRIYQPGCKFEMVPILEGKQGIGKSSVCKAIFPEKFLDGLPDLGKNKDSYELLVPNVVIELAELSALRKTDIESVKRFVSMQVDKFRAPYARTPEEFPRHCVFIGTTNTDDFLKDLTGNRRWYPLKCGVVPVRQHVTDAGTEGYMLQILAESKHLYEAGHPVYLTNSQMNLAKEAQQEFMEENPDKSHILDYLSLNFPKDWNERSIESKNVGIDELRRERRNSKLRTGNSSGDEFEKLMSVSVAELLANVFKNDPHEYQANKNNQLSKKIRLIMNSLDDWEADKLSIRLSDDGKLQQVRGWKRRE